jgi:hypothetical protein
MNMRDNTVKKVLFTTSSLSLILGSALNASILETKYGSVFLDASAEVSYDTNIYANAAEESDVIFKLSPALRYVQQRGLVSLKAESGINLSRYADNDDEDAEDFFFRANLAGPNRDDAATSYALNAGWVESTTADPILGAVTAVATTTLGGTVEYQLTDKTGIRFGGDYANTNFDRAGQGDADNYRARVDALYYYSQKLSLNAGYRYGLIDQEIASAEVDSHTFAIGATGELTEKVTGNIDGGYQYNDTFSGIDRTYYYSVGLDWAAREKTTVSLTGSRDIAPSSSLGTATSTTLTTTLAQSLTETISASVFATAGKLELDGINQREHDFYRVGTSVGVELNEYGSVSVGVSYEDRDADTANSTYGRVISYVGLNLSF